MVTLPTSHRVAGICGGIIANVQQGLTSEHHDALGCMTELKIKYHYVHVGKRKCVYRERSGRGNVRRYSSYSIRVLFVSVTP